MLILSADLLLWLNAVTEDSVHQEIELEKQDGLRFSNTTSSEAENSDVAGSQTSHVQTQAISDHLFIQQSNSCARNV